MHVVGARLSSRGRAVVIIDSETRNDREHAFSVSRESVWGQVCQVHAVFRGPTRRAVRALSQCVFVQSRDERA